MARVGIRTLALPILVAGAALVPLYGDPRATPVTHPEWARLVLRGLEMGEMLRAGTQASQVFSLLSWKNSLTLDAEHYTRAEGVNVVGHPPRRHVVATAPVAEVSYAVAVVRGGDYRLRLNLAGSASTSAEVTRVGETQPAGAFSVQPAASMGWIEAGTAKLDPGVYSASVLLPAGSSLEALELAPPCLNPIEPSGGWRATAIASTADVAVTALQAIDLESELPPSDVPVEVAGSDFRVTGGTVPTRSLEASPEANWLRAGPRGLQATAFVDLSEPGLYTISALGIEGGGQSWQADSCRKAKLCPHGEPGQAPQWRTILSGVFTSGRHFFAVTLGPGAVVARLRVERKRDAGTDYLGTIRRLGFEPGPDGQPITRSRAVDAMNWIRERHRLAPIETCAEIELPAETLQADLPPPPGSPGLPGFPGVPVIPAGPPVVPPQEPASPVEP